MRVEAHEVGSVIHVIKRGARGADITRDMQDRERFVRSLFYLNDSHTDPYWHRETAELEPPNRPASWPERNPLVRVLAWTLLSSHFHLLLQEIREGGVAKFMQRLGGSMSTCFNAKYQEHGSLFQGGYRGVVVDENAHLNYLAFYILVKNVLDMYPGGLVAASTNFDDAWEWAKKYPYSSFSELVSGKYTPIVEDGDGLLSSVVGREDSFKNEARELLLVHINSRGKEFKKLMLEHW